MLKGVFAFVAIITALSSQAEANHLSSWNDLLGAEGLFVSENKFFEIKSDDDASILSHLNSVLSEERLLEKLYNNYLNIYEKNNGDETRMAYFKDQLLSIAAHNLEARNGKHSWTQGVNQFTDMTDLEFEMQYTSNFSAWADSVQDDDMTEFLIPEVGSPPIGDSKDWTQYVNTVKEQGNCTSCVMFALTGQLEARKAIQKNNGQKTPDLSPQELLDCAVSNFKCSDPGTNPVNSADYLQSKGVTTWANYPYNKPAEKKPCKASNSNKVAKVKAYSQTQGVAETVLRDWVAKYGPIFSTVYTGPWAKTYGGGIVTNESCGNNKMNHAILVVGYGTDKNTDYWLIKNSYSPKWGERGYFRLKRNANNACRIGGWCFVITAEN